MPAAEGGSTHTGSIAAGWDWGTGADTGSRQRKHSGSPRPPSAAAPVGREEAEEAAGGASSSGGCFPHLRRLRYSLCSPFLPFSDPAVRNSPKGLWRSMVERSKRSDYVSLISGRERRSNPPTPMGFLAMTPGGGGRAEDFFFSFLFFLGWHNGKLRKAPLTEKERLNGSR